MDTLQVSMELWERIIDLVGIESNTDPIAYYPTIRTCCLVCPLWLPRSRYNLYHTVSITEQLSRSGLNLVHCLARTVRERADLAFLINELHVQPKTLGRAVPLVVAMGPGSWASSMVSLRSLKLIGVGWHPVLYNTAISRFPAPVHLELRRVAFDSASSLFHLIWSLPHLECVNLHHITIPKLSQMKSARICSTCPKTAMGSLTELSISGILADAEHFPPPGAFGTALRKVSLEFSSKHWHRTRLRELLLTSTTLEEFHARICLSDGETPPDRVCSEMMSLLSKRSTTRLVKLNLRPTSFVRGGYGVSRSRMADALLSLSPPPSSGELLEVKLSLFDETVIHDSVWWSTTLSSRRPRHWGDVLVDVQQSYVQELWLREPDPPAERPLRKKALLVGVQYGHEQEVGSSHAIRDVKRFWELLISRFNYRPEDIAVLVSEEGFDCSLSPTREHILNEIEILVSEFQDGDRLVFFYYGDTMQLSNQDFASEDGFDEALIPIDYTEDNGKTILDNELRGRLVDVLPAGVKLSAIFDSHSTAATLLDLEHYTCNNVYVPWVDEYPAMRGNAPRRSGPAPGGANAYEPEASRPDRTAHAYSRPWKPSSEHEADPGIHSGPHSTPVHQPGDSPFPGPALVDEEVRVKPARRDGRPLERSHSESALPSLPASPFTPTGVFGGVIAASPEPMDSCDGWCEVNSALGSNSVISLCGSLESGRYSFAQLLMDVLEEDVARSYREVLQAVLHKMYTAERRSSVSRFGFLQWAQPLMGSSRPMDMESMFIL